MKAYYKAFSTFVALILFLALLIGCNDASKESNKTQSFLEPKTNEEWKAFCEASDSHDRIKAIEDKEKRMEVGSTCLHTPWKKIETVPGSKVGNFTF